MSKKSEWRYKAEQLILTHHPREIAELLFSKSGYKDKENFRKKVYQVLKESEKKLTVKNKDYKEVRKNDGTVTITDIVERKLSDKELFARFGRSDVEWRISMVWFKEKNDGFLLSCCFVPIQPKEQPIKISDEFISRLNKIKPKSCLLAKKLDKKLPQSMVLIGKQDAHLDKFDILGDNSIEGRFNNFRNKLICQISKVSKTNSIDKIYYVIGSDEFNSEWNGGTTKGTPQKNILSHQESFEKITEFNIEMIELLCGYCYSLDVILVGGNHDFVSGWHLAHVLSRVFHNSDHVVIDKSVLNTKVVSWGDNLILLNHGDEMTPKDLAAKFPLIANDLWSKHSNYFVITGDKHHEFAHDYNGVFTYKLPQLSRARSDWDDKKGFVVSKAEMVTLVFEQDGLSNILKTKM